ncbi:hypothetical protein SKAU_G00158350 [Synaphobranchus kaupii]|uniref:Uncharacterized protein n=1 Tax=Synaphobranchus kaupii TaxID=118154 RepID=A0A9Q1IZH9_SYNKA|nr:hypothetical protein SKAU_G00158350 [Synaphobranchus kaupii]
MKAWGRAGRRLVRGRQRRERQIKKTGTKVPPFRPCPAFSPMAYDPTDEGFATNALIGYDYLFEMEGEV